MRPRYDAHPFNALLAARRTARTASPAAPDGFSGRGFKFAPVIGKTMAELVVGGKPAINLHRFRLRR